VILLFPAAKSRLYRTADGKNKTSSNALQAVSHRLWAAELTNASNFRYFIKYMDSGNIPAFWNLSLPSSCPAVDSSSRFAQMVTMGRHSSSWETLCTLLHPFDSSISNWPSWLGLTKYQGTLSSADKLISPFPEDCLQVPQTFGN